jgi:RsiW-degrading membrane proteinase PrsW (M82 family)
MVRQAHQDGHPELVEEKKQQWKFYCVIWVNAITMHLLRTFIKTKKLSENSESFCYNLIF